MIWPFRRQADEARRLLDALVELHQHINDSVAGCDATEAERELRHMLRVLEARAGAES